METKCRSVRGIKRLKFYDNTDAFPKITWSQTGAPGRRWKILGGILGTACLLNGDTRPAPHPILNYPIFHFGFNNVSSRQWGISPVLRVGHDPYIILRNEIDLRVSCLMLDKTF